MNVSITGQNQAMRTQWKQSPAVQHFPPISYSDHIHGSIYEGTEDRQGGESSTAGYNKKQQCKKRTFVISHLLCIISACISCTDGCSTQCFSGCEISVYVLLCHTT